MRWGWVPSKLGPEALTLAAILNKQMGLSLGHTQQVLCYGFGMKASRAGLYRALARMARRTEPTYAGLVATARQSPVNAAVNAMQTIRLRDFFILVPFFGYFLTLVMPGICPTREDDEGRDSGQ